MYTINAINDITALLALSDAKLAECGLVRATLERERDKLYRQLAE